MRFLAIPYDRSALAPSFDTIEAATWEDLFLCLAENPKSPFALLDLLIANDLAKKKRGFSLP